ncbi:MAG: phosphate ABC transporter substrate-binding protein [Candidatus Handelsmanbacteria bacterium]|nr:phosphate ABC transporter substrate-binding protein [Candidatus Handelsmanbacteria bacterium]
MHSILTLAAAGVLVASALQAQAPSVDARYQPYAKTSGVSGYANSIGSDTMNNLMTLWLEGFRKFYPNVTIQIEGKGSSTAPPALIEGTAQFGPMSRSMKSTEIDQFEAKFGYKPTELGTSLDALAVFVNKDNPVQGLSMQQVDAIFSKTRKGGAAADINTWGQLGLQGDRAAAKISLYGRNSASGTYGFFKDHALAKGDFKDEVKEQPGSASVVQGITTDRFGIGYSGIGYITSGVRALPLAAKEGQPFKEANLQNVMEGAYPLGRFLYLYINKAPGKELDPLVREFGKFVFSKEGQEIVIKDGYMPVPFEVAQKELAKLSAK